MTVTVAPLTTTVMNALDAAHAGVASGVNNAVSRAAGLLAIALLGIVMQRAYDGELDRRIAATQLPAARKAVEDAVAGAFVHGFRWMMGMSALLALGGAVCAWAMLGRTPERD
jgi:hypothetical protein